MTFVLDGSFFYHLILGFRFDFVKKIYKGCPDKNIKCMFFGQKKGIKKWAKIDDFLCVKRILLSFAEIFQNTFFCVELNSSFFLEIFSASLRREKSLFKYFFWTLSYKISNKVLFISNRNLKLQAKRMRILQMRAKFI